MIGHVLSLTRWEWFKLYRRRMPWVLLLIAIAIAQLVFWSTYAFVQSGGPANQTSRLFAATATAGESVTFDLTCGEIGDLREGDLPVDLERFSPEERERIARDLQEFAEDCRSVIGQSDSIRQSMLPPHSLRVSMHSTLAFFGVILVMILAASIPGTEYGWGTLRTVLIRGVGRWQLLASKALVTALVSVGLSVVVLVVVGVASVIASLTLEGGELVGFGEWSDLAVSFGKLIYVYLPYVALAVLMSVLSSSSGMGIAISVGYYIIEQIVVGILASFDWFEGISTFVLGRAASGWMDVDEFSFGPGGIGALPDDLPAALVMLAYTVILGGLAFWLFQRKDVAGAKGG
ncbi:MAG: ABC transporter permease subunit [Chloroflexota bacterium]|nr:ABC transporter permease subunit [Chloroflexota bacterium]